MTYKATVQESFSNTIRKSTALAFFPCKLFYPTDTVTIDQDTHNTTTSTFSSFAKFMPAVITTAITTAVALAFMAVAIPVYVVAYIVAAFLDLFKGCFSSSVKADQQDNSNSLAGTDATEEIKKESGLIVADVCNTEVVDNSATCSADNGLSF